MMSTVSPNRGWMWLRCVLGPSPLDASLQDSWPKSRRPAAAWGLLLRAVMFEQ
jgi:hypothetical protein